MRHAARAARGRRRSWRRCTAAGVDPDRPAPMMLGAEEAASRFATHPLAAITPLVRGTARRGVRRSPSPGRDQRRRRDAAVGRRAPADARGRTGTALQAGRALQRGGGRHERRRDRARARARGADLLGRALQPAPAWLDLRRGARARPGVGRDPRGDRPLLFLPERAPPHARARDRGRAGRGDATGARSRAPRGGPARALHRAAPGGGPATERAGGRRRTRVGCVSPRVARAARRAAGATRCCPTAARPCSSPSRTAR